MNPLVSRAQDGDQAAFEQLYRAHVGRVYALCLRMTADPSRAEELTQDVFVRTWRRLGSFRGRSAFSSWLYRLTVNVVLGALRTERRRDRRVTLAADLDELEVAAPAPAGGTALDLEAGIRALPPRARTVLVLHDIEGYTHDEVGKLMDIAPGTAKAQLHRARTLLRCWLER